MKYQPLTERYGCAILSRMEQEYVCQGHLGGYIKGGDEAGIYPELWSWLVNTMNVKSVLDIGCGEGHALKAFRDLGCRVKGIDGIAQPDPDILQFDFTKQGVQHATEYDLAWTCEFVEHVEEQYIHNVAPSFQACNLVLMTHAVPGQGGYHHVNCRDAEYWKGYMAALGFRFDANLTYAAKQLAALNTSPWNHFVASGLAFRKS